MTKSYPPPVSESGPAALVDKAARLKESITAQTEELHQINQQLAQSAQFKEGSRTGYAFGRLFTARVQLRTNEKWDQKALEEARQKMGDEEFFKIFDWSFKPTKALAGALQFSPHAKLIEAARTCAPGAPQVTFEKLEDC